MSEEENGTVEPEAAETIPQYYDALDGLLKQTHLNDNTQEIIKRNYIRNTQEFESNPWRMMNFLTALGVRDTVARFLASRFWSITKNIDLDSFQTLMGPPQQPNPYGFPNMGVGFPNQQPPQQQYPMPVQQMDDADMKMMRMMMMMKMMNQPQQSSMFDPMQMMMMQAMMQGGMRWEPVLDGTGKPVMNQTTGQPVMGFTMMPAQQHQAISNQPDPYVEFFKEVVKGQNEQKRASDDRLFQMQQKTREMEADIAERENRALKRRIAMVEQERSSDRLLEDMERLKKFGLFPTGGVGPESVEIEKLRADQSRWQYERQTDLEKFKLEHELEARKWYKERELEETRERRTQEKLDTLGSSLKDIAQTVVTPVLSSITAGAMSGRQPEEVPNVSSLDNQSLMNQYQEVERIENRAEAAKKMLKEEMEKRMAQQNIRPPPVPQPTVASSGPKLDLGPLSDYSFDEQEEEEEEEEISPDELILTAETDDDYNVEY